MSQYPEKRRNDAQGDIPHTTKKSSTGKKKRKHSNTWIMSVVGECLLVIPVIVILIIIGQFFH